jgi:hypothetical protein
VTSKNSSSKRAASGVVARRAGAPYTSEQVSEVPFYPLGGHAGSKSVAHVSGRQCVTVKLRNILSTLGTRAQAPAHHASGSTLVVA